MTRPEWLIDVAYWPKADVTWERRGVRYQAESGYDADWSSLPSLTQLGHCAVLYRQSRRRLPQCALVGALTPDGRPRPMAVTHQHLLLLALLLATVARVAQADEGPATVPRF